MCGQICGGINRNIVECKGSKFVNLHTVSCTVLIETSWNVKVPVAVLRFFCRIVLIETSWNVKTIGLTERQAAASINRNIVECKDNCSVLFSVAGM